MYRLFYRLVLQHLPAEFTHRVLFALLRLTMALPGVRALARRWMAPRDPALEVRALGRVFPGPLGLAAGFDKDARGVDALLGLGFGSVEVGTITAEGQPGNPKPRMFRLPRDRALINRLGFNNRGSAVAQARLTRHPPDGVVGINIGKTKLATDEIADYETSAARLARLADYMVVNVSSPNTPGLRDLQAVDRLRPLLAAVQATIARVTEGGRRVPLLVKIAPDLADADVDAVADLALELRLDGIIATNTTIARTGLDTPAAEVEALGNGGLSGAPLEARALAVLRRLRARVGDRLVLVAAGGIHDADAAWARIRAGATLLQAYTGFIYGGPMWPRHVQRALARRARAEGFARVQDAVGTD